MCEISPLDPAEVGRDQSRVVGGDTGSVVPLTNHLFYVLAVKEKLLFWAYLWLFKGSDGVSLGRTCLRLQTQLR